MDNNFIETTTIGEILQEEFMEPMGISAYKLAQEIHVPTSRIQDILHGRRKITADTSLRLAKLFGVSDGYCHWILKLLTIPGDMVCCACGKSHRYWRLSYGRNKRL